jgi:hypothetical protein
LEPGALIQLGIKPDLDFRRVKLFSGRVNFKVAKDPSKPFIVESGTLMTTALGTEFIVDYNAAVEHVLIRLFEGKVRVESIEPSVVETNILKPGQQIYFGGEQDACFKFQRYAKNEREGKSTSPAYAFRNGKPYRNGNNSPERQLAPIGRKPLYLILFNISIMSLMYLYPMIH